MSTEVLLDYNPKEDITLYELSKVLVVLLAVSNGTLTRRSQAVQLLERIGPDAARHFELEEVPSEPSYT